MRGLASTRTGELDKCCCRSTESSPMLLLATLAVPLYQALKMLKQGSIGLRRELQVS